MVRISVVTPLKTFQQFYTCYVMFLYSHFHKAFGGPDRHRTCNRSRARGMLSRLSYKPTLNYFTTNPEINPLTNPTPNHFNLLLRSAAFSAANSFASAV